MKDSDKQNFQTFRDLFPSSTTIVDFAYSKQHPLRLGDFPLSKSRDGIPQDEWFLRDHDVLDEEHEEADSEAHAYSSDEINCKAIALFDFIPENDNEVALSEGQEIWISYRHGQGWLVAEDPETGENGLVPEEYVEIFYDEALDNPGQKITSPDDTPKPFLPEILQAYPKDGSETDGEWVDTENESESEVEIIDSPAAASALDGGEAKISTSGNLEANNTVNELETKVANASL